MRRIRVTLLMVSLALLASVGALTWRALDGLALERAIRHQTVSDRVFEEMERALSRFLEREEERPFEEYGFYPDDSGRPSPLARGETEDFVVGAFQIDPDGSVYTPLRPRDRGDWPPAPDIERRIEIVTRLAGAAWPAEAGAALGGSAAGQRDARQAPGTTRAVGGRLAGDEYAVRRDADRARDVQEATAYELLRTLDRAGESRAERKQKIEQAPSHVARYAADLQPVPSLVEAPPLEGSEGDTTLSAAPAAAERELRLRASLAAEAAEPAADTGVRIALDPMAGRAADEQHLLLYRTVLVGQQGYRQGLVLERSRLGAWLEREVIQGNGLERVASIRFRATGATPAPPDEGAAYVFDHRFAEPFDALTARLALSSLPGVGSPGAVYGLVGLLVLVGAVGLLAVYRMVGVAVHFAERRSNFVSAVTHELKTPLTAIRMYGEMLRDGLVDAEDKRSEYYGTITDESERLSRLIDNVLEFARLERGTREMSWTVGSVAPVLEEAVAKLRAHAGREGFSLVLQIEPGLPAIRFDRDALLQVLFNLADNAMKYARSARDRSIVLEARRAAGGVHVAVRDHGPGVPGSQLPRIFEPFYRAGDEGTRTTRGTGIGLALVKELAERMGAAVSGANAEGGGFRVRLVFPDAPGAARA
ncbi:MAG TPA: HAMP domain-containing sensor histidine kinase [Myxococcota bacterium]